MYFCRVNLPTNVSYFQRGSVTMCIYSVLYCKCNVEVLVLSLYISFTVTPLKSEEDIVLLLHYIHFNMTYKQNMTAQKHTKQKGCTHTHTLTRRWVWRGTSRRGYGRHSV